MLRGKPVGPCCFKVINHNDEINLDAKYSIDESLKDYIEFMYEFINFHQTNEFREFIIEKGYTKEEFNIFDEKISKFLDIELY